MDTRTEKVTKVICQECRGNGFIRVPYSEARDEQWADCDTCNNQGEIVVEKTNVQNL